ncbi:MAG: hypothetical protein ABW042_07365 [Phenylobacterium sp.]
MWRTLGLAACCGGALLAYAAPASAEKFKTDDEAQRSSLTYAVTAPLRDINLVRSDIPVVLKLAYEDPYRRPERSSCSALVTELELLNAALGDDLDAGNVSKTSMSGRAKEEALNAIAGLASDVIPFRSWVRKLSGAEGHDRLVSRAIAAGAVRRAYLKGLGEAKGCEPPATPLHKSTAAVPETAAPAEPATIAQGGATVTMVSAPAY